MALMHYLRGCFVAGLSLAVALAENLAPERLADFPDLAMFGEEEEAVIELAGRFRDPDLGGIPVRVLVRATGLTSAFDLVLFETQTPQTTANFLRYVDEGRFDDNIIHRLVPGFVVQGGGYYFIDDSTFDHVPVFQAVPNEPGISNLRGTVAMAKLGGNPDSATSQWFVNLADNSANLDAQNGGFTVFGRVLGSGMEVVDTIAALPRYNASSIDPAWTDLPLTQGQLAREFFVQTTIVRVAELSYQASTNAPEKVAAEIEGDRLRLRALPGAAGEVEVTLLASDLEGAAAVTRFKVLVGKLPQVIQADIPASLRVGSVILPSRLTASSGLPVTMEVVSGPVRQTAAGELEMIGVGEVVLRVTQVGDELYASKTEDFTLRVEPAQLTVQAQDRYKLVGQPNPTLGVNYEGLLAYAPVSSLAQPVSVSTTAVLRSPVGAYPVVVSGGSDPRYTITRVPGTLHVVNYAGSYETLMEREDGVCGHLRVTVTSDSRRYSATLQWDDLAAPLNAAGALTLHSETGWLSANHRWPPVAGRAALDLNFAVKGEALTATLQPPAGQGVIQGLGARRFVKPARANAPWAGAHTLVLISPQGDDLAGHGYARATIANTGVLTLAGRLADGRPLSGALYPDAAGGFRVYLKPYGNRAFSRLAGSLMLSAHPDVGRFPGRYHIAPDVGRLSWRKAPGAKDATYRSGIGARWVAVALDPWLAPVTKPVPITLGARLRLPDNRMLVDQSSPHLGAHAPLLPGLIGFVSATKGLAVAGGTADATKWTLVVQPATGLFTGSFVLRDTLAAPTVKNPSATRLVTRTVVFQGILRQTPAADSSGDLVGAGYFLVAAPGAPKTVQPESGELTFKQPDRLP